MRIATHIGIQTAALVAGAAVLTLFVREQTSAALAAREVVRNDDRDLESFERLASGADAVMTVGDIVFGGGTTYLAEPAIDKSADLQKITVRLADGSLGAPFKATWKRVQEDAAHIAELFRAAIHLDPEDRDARLNAMLLRFDEHTFSISSQLDELRGTLEQRVKDRRAAAEASVARAQTNVYVVSLLFLATIFLAWTYLRVVLGRPIQRLASRAAASREGAEFVVPEGGPLEVHDLAEGFSELVHDLEETVTRRTEALERALESRSEFLANTSHELRTPMNAILGFTEILSEEDLDAEERRKYLHHVRTSGRHLMGLIEDVLDLTKIDAGKMVVENIPYSPQQVLDEAAAMLRSQAEGKGLEFRSLVNGKQSEVLGDPTRLRQVLVNLGANAIKFTESGSVELRIVCQASRLHVEVTDTGVGIPEHKLETIFGAFEQADASDTRRFGGTGLGLAISRELTRLMGGELNVRSTPGEGSTFYFDITAEPTIEAPLPKPAQVSTTASGRLLLVDDVATNRLLGRRICEKIGINVAEAEDGQDAVLTFQAAVEEGRPFDLVLMDLQMPVVDGYEATRQIRALGFEGPIIALTAAVLPEHRDAALEAGCDDFLTKPIDASALAAVMSSHLSSDSSAA